MGQKVHPYGFRLGMIYGWQSNWFAERRYAPQLHEDVRIRHFIKKKLYHAGISQRRDRAHRRQGRGQHPHRAPGHPDRQARRGGRGAAQGSRRAHPGEVFINIQEIRKAEIDAQLVAENVAMQLERRVAFRRAMKKAVTATMKFGAQGIRIQCVGPPRRRRDGSRASGTARAACRCTRCAPTSSTASPRPTRPTV